MLLSMLFWIVVTALGADDPSPQEVEAKITYAAGDVYYIDAGSDAGLSAGAEGTVVREESEIARVRVRSVSRSSSSVEVIRRLASTPPRVGDRTVFRIEPPPSSGVAGKESGEGREVPEGEDAFVPLLATPETLRARTTTSNVFHGWLSAGTSSTDSRRTDLEYHRFRLGTGGSLDRIGGGPWSLEWNLDGYYRTGSGYRDRDGYREEKIQANLLVLRRHFSDGSVVGVGRIQPLALPSIGLVDGLYGEYQAAEGLRLGLVSGFRPTVDDQGFSTDEIAVAPYGVWETGSREAARLSTSAGLLATWFEGDADRQALLWDARFDFLSRYSLWVTSAIDFYSGYEEKRSGTGLTRLGAHASADLHELLRVRADVTKNEIPDTLAGGALLVDPEAQLDSGYRRATFGLGHDFGYGWGLEESVSQIVSADTDDEIQGWVRGSKYGMFGIPGSFVDVSVFNLIGRDLDGLGATGSLGAAPLETVHLRLGYLLTGVDEDRSGDTSFRSHTVSLDVDWYVTRRLSLTTRLGESFGDEDGSTMLSFLITWRW